MTKNMPTAEVEELACERLFKFMQQLHRFLRKKRFEEKNAIFEKSAKCG